MKKEFHSTRWVRALSVIGVLVFILLFWHSWQVFTAYKLNWSALLPVALLSVVIVIALLDWYFSKRRYQSDLKQAMNKIGAGPNALRDKLELLLAPAAPRVLNKGLPQQLLLRRRNGGRYAIAGLLTLIAGFFVLGGMVGGHYAAMLIGSAPLFIFLLFQTRKIPPTVSADSKGVRIGQVRKAWTEIIELKPVNVGTNGAMQIQILWSKAGLSKFAWRALQAGGAQVDLRMYSSSYSASEEAFACLKIWQHRALRQVSEARNKAEMDAKFARLDQLMRDDPKVFEEEMEKERTEMESLLKDLERKRATQAR